MTPNEEIELATYTLEKNKLMLDRVEIEEFDKEVLRGFIAQCNETKLSAVKILRVLDGAVN